MKRYEKILVAMNIEETDSSLIEFAAKISQLANSSEVHFYHISDETDLPAELCSTLESHAECETITGKIEDIVGQFWTGPEDARLIYEASGGDMLKDALVYIKQNDIDLVLVQNICRSSKIPERLARKAPCSIMLVPPGAKPSFENIHAAVDFSEQSREAFEMVLALANASGAEKVTAVHVFSVPLGYHKTGRTYEEFSEILRRNAEEEYERCMNDIDTKGIETPLIVKTDEAPHKGIVDLVHGNGADLLAVGTRGRSKTMAILLGSVAERLIETCRVPILAVKRKGQGWSFLEALFDL
jgi:nucleotide-binding universal stress UspA family protein